MSIVATFTDLLLKEQPFSFVKFGDGELACMRGAVGANTDGHPYSPELGSRLRSAFSFLGAHPEVYLAEWQGAEARGSWEFGTVLKPVTFFDCLLLHCFTAELREFYEVLAADQRAKIFVGPARLQGAVRLLNCLDHIEVPLLNAFERHEEVLDRLLIQPDDAIYIFCAGMTSKVWISELVSALAGITCLDLGSAMDPLFVGKTRSGQPSMEEARAFFGMESCPA